MNDVNNNLIFDVKEENFLQEVIEGSDKKLILVDFWAPWCGPCKQLTPILEKLTEKSKGKFLLAKVNIDNSQQIASQLKIQSIPAVFAVKDKKIVDSFQGIIPESKIIEFIEKHLDEKLEKDFSEFYKLINEMFSEKKFTEAKDAIEEHLSENSNDIKSISLYLDCLCELNLFEEISSFISSLEENILDSNFIKPIIQKINIKKKNSHGPSLDDLRSSYKKNPDKIKNIISFSEKLFAENYIDEAFEILFNNFSKNKEVKKNKILEFFEALGNTNEKTISYRKRLSSIIFS